MARATKTHYGASGETPATSRRELQNTQGPELRFRALLAKRHQKCASNGR